MKIIRKISGSVLLLLGISWIGAWLVRIVIDAYNVISNWHTFTDGWNYIVGSSYFSFAAALRWLSICFGLFICSLGHSLAFKKRDNFSEK